MSTPTHGLVTRNPKYHDDNRPALVGVYPSAEAAEQAKANAEAEYPNPEVMHLGDYEKARRSFHLDAPDELTFCGESDYYEMRDVVPPKHYRRTDTFGRFVVGEAYCGTVHRQYARFETETRTLFAWRHVDATDEDTWITRREMERAAKLRPETYTGPDATAASGPAIRNQFGS